MNKTSRRNLIMVFEYCAFLIAISLVVHSVIISKWEVTAASLAVIAAIISNFNSQRITWKQEDELEADVDIKFDVKSIGRLVLLVFENTGGSIAYDIKYNIKPAMKIINEKEIESDSILFIEKKRKIQVPVMPTIEMLEENKNNQRPSEYLVEFSFSQSKGGKKIFKKKWISIEPYRKTVLIHPPTKNIEDNLEKIAKAITKISK